MLSSSPFPHNSLSILPPPRCSSSLSYLPSLLSCFSYLPFAPLSSAFLVSPIFWSTSPSVTHVSIPPPSVCVCVCLFVLCSLPFYKTYSYLGAQRSPYGSRRSSYIRTKKWKDESPPQSPVAAPRSPVLARSPNRHYRNTSTGASQPSAVVADVSSLNDDIATKTAFKYDETLAEQVTSLPLVVQSWGVAEESELQKDISRCS